MLGLGSLFLRQQALNHLAGAHAAPVVSVAWAPDEACVASGDRSGCVVLWHKASDAQLDSLPSSSKA